MIVCNVYIHSFQYVWSINIWNCTDAKDKNACRDQPSDSARFFATEAEALSLDPKLYDGQPASIWHTWS